MSYQVIARKWRPKNFKELVGQDHISQTLLNALRANRLPHALLLTGTRGVGKTSVARILAKTLLCENPQDFSPCQKCSACLETIAGSHVDVIELDGASNNGVDAIRELRETVSYTPVSGKYKIYIIDEVHMLTTSAFNALLKTLEEPPPHVIFVLATTEVQKIPITILSRCQRFDLRRISTRLIRDHIEHICKTETITFEPDALWTLARAADGSMRDGLSLLDQVINFTDKNLTYENVAQVLGLTDRNLLLNTLQSLIERDLEGITTAIEQISTNGYDPSQFLKDLLEEIRHLLFAKLSQKSEQLLDLADSEIENLKKLGAHLSSEDIHMLFDMALKGANDILRSQNPRVVLEMILMRMSQAPRIIELRQVLNNGFSTPSQKPALKTSSSSPSPRVNPTAHSQPQTEKKKTPGTWDDLVRHAQKDNPLLAAQLVHVSMLNRTDQELTLGILPQQKFLADQLMAPKSIEKLSKFIELQWGQLFKIQIQVTDNPPPSIATQEKQKLSEQKQEIRERVEKHPLIKSVKEVFKSEIQSIKETK